MPACPHCGQTVAATDTRCPRCGVALSAATFESAGSAAGAETIRVTPSHSDAETDATLVPGISAPSVDTAGDRTLVPSGSAAAVGAEDPAYASASTGGDDDGPTVTCARCGAEHEPADACPVCGSLRSPVPCDEHPDRTAHSRCVLCGRAVCERDIDEGRRPSTCAEHRNVPVIEGWAQVFSTATEVEAQLLAENLRAEGIDSQIYTQADRIFPVDLGELSIVRLLVPVWEYEQALGMIRGYMDTRGEVVFACPACGEVYEPGQEACSACGASLTE
jgi:rubrerythrin